MALSILESTNTGVKYSNVELSRGLSHLFFLVFSSEIQLDFTANELSFLITPFDIKRLDSYANGALDYHIILDLLPSVASLYFEKRLGNEVKLSAVQSSVLLALGLQRKTVEDIEVCSYIGLQGLFFTLGNCFRQSFSYKSIKFLLYSAKSSEKLQVD